MEHDVLVPGGRHSVAGPLDFTDVAQTARHLEVNAPNAHALVMPGVAHLIAMEAPNRLNALVLVVAGLEPWLGSSGEPSGEAPIGSRRA